MTHNIISTDKPPGNFLLQADKDYLAARLLFGSGSLFHGLSAYHSQQSLEKYIKAYTVQEAKQFLKTHDLIELAKMANSYCTYFSRKEVIDQLAQFNVYDQVTRYGAEAFYDPLSQKESSFKTAGVMFFSGTHIEMLDGLVYNIRGLLDFSKVGYSDNLKAILIDQKENIFVGTWHLSIPIKMVLTANNKFYK